MEENSMKQNDVVINNAVISAVTITGPKDRQEEITQLYLRAREIAIALEGVILRINQYEEGFEGGFFLEISFKNEEKRDRWKKEMNIE
jgi:hypothetical protein